MTPLTTLEWANEYFAGRLNSSAWESADEDTRTKAITTASRVLSAFYVIPQKLFDDVPEWLQMATCEQAIYLLSVDPTAIPSLLLKGFSQAAAGPISVTADWEFTAPLLSELAEQMIGDQLEEAVASGGIRTSLYERSA